MRIKYRVGVMPGPWPAGDAGRDFFWRFVDLARRARSTRSGSPSACPPPLPLPEPMTAMAAVAARTTRLKFGPSVFVTPFRNPVLMAREIAMVDYLSNGRILPAFGIGAEQEREFLAAGVRVQERGRRTDEAIAIMRRCWSEDEVTFAGDFWRLDRITRAAASRPAAARAVDRRQQRGRPCDGPAGSATAGSPRSSLPSSSASGSSKTQAFAAEAGRRGAGRSLRRALLLLHRSRPGRRPGAGRAVHPARSHRRRGAGTLHGLRSGRGRARATREYIAGGGSKFIVRPMCPPERMLDQLGQLASDVIPRPSSPLSGAHLRRRRPRRAQPERRIVDQQIRIDVAPGEDHAHARARAGSAGDPTARRRPPPHRTARERCGRAVPGSGRRRAPRRR